MTRPKPMILVVSAEKSYKAAQHQHEVEQDAIEDRAGKLGRGDLVRMVVRI